MKVAVIGCDSLLGENIASLVSRELQCDLLLFSTDTKKKIFLPNAEWIEIDINDKKGLKKDILQAQPDVIVNCLTIEGIEECESDRALAWNINVDFNAIFASASKILENHYITFSDHNIFDGAKGPYSEQDAVNAISYFAKSMLARENTCAVELTNYTLFRLTDVFGTSSFEKLDLVAKFLLLFETGIDFEVSNSHYSNPIVASDAALAVVNSIERKKYGLYHLGGSSYINKYEIACKIGNIFGFGEDQVIETASSKTLKLGLSSLKAETDLRVKFTEFENALTAMKYNSEGLGKGKFL